MSDDFAPVAEYRNVAIMEQKGTKRSVWKGKEYKTDGFLYLFERAQDGNHIGIIQLKCEKDAKIVIEAIAEPKQCLSYVEALELLQTPPDAIERYRKNPSQWAWDELQECFIEAVSDGQHRLKGKLQ